VPLSSRRAEDFADGCNGNVATQTRAMAKHAITIAGIRDNMEGERWYVISAA
jgi:hypothetical protein